MIRVETLGSICEHCEKETECSFRFRVGEKFHGSKTMTLIIKDCPEYIPTQKNAPTSESEALAVLSLLKVDEPYRDAFATALQALIFKIRVGEMLNKMEDNR